MADVRYGHADVHWTCSVNVYFVPQAEITAAFWRRDRVMNSTPRPAAAVSLGLKAGESIWASVKATEIRAYPA